MLCLYQSNRLEYLAAMLASVYRLQPSAAPWVPAEIIVQSQGMRRYLSRFLAQQHGIAANLHFSLPAGFAWQLTRRVLPDTPPLNPFQTNVLHWRLLALFQSEVFTRSELTLAHAALTPYLSSSDQAPYHLAGKLADIFDQYLIYRSDWIDAWQNNRLLNLGADEAWQAQLWQYLAKQTDTPHRIAQQQALLNALRPEHLPERVWVFGIATLAPLYLNLLQAMAMHTDVHVFAVNPSSEYWGNVLPAAQLLSLDNLDREAGGHPLLASLGKQGRDFFDALSDIPNVSFERAVYDDSTAADTLLHRLQNDIQQLRLPESQTVQPDDDSIQLVAAHSRLRELQILKDQLLQDLAAHPDWQPADIAVLTPHIEHYLPFIEAVFGQSQGGSQSLPHTIADVKISHRQALMQLFAKLLDLMASRFEIDAVLPLLDEPALRRRFALSDDDVAVLSAAWHEQGVRWGTDAAMRTTYGGNSARFTWQQARERTVLGWLLPQTDTPQTWQGMLPWFGNSDPGLLARGQTLLDTLISHYRQWQQPADMPAWLARIRRLLHDTADDDSLAGSAMQQLESALADWEAQTALAHFTQPLTADLVIEHVQGFLNSERQAGFLRGGITFCSMVPMRSLPFKCVCLLGLNDGEFPRTTKSAAFDLIARHPRKGDRARRDDDRYLFLESILSAREKLYLSYIGKDIRKNETLAPSALLFELTDVLAAMAGCSPAEFNAQHIVQHPLQPFSLRYFQGELPTTRCDYAAALSQPAQNTLPFFRQPFSAAAATDITTTALIDFWRNPVKAWLKQQLQWHAPYADTTDTAAEPFAIEQPDIVLDALVTARRQNRDFADTDHALQQMGVLPEGLLGDLAEQRWHAAALSLNHDLLYSPPVADAVLDCTLSNIHLTGSLSGLHRHGQLIDAARAPNAPDTIALYLRHLLFCAADVPGIAHDTHYLYPPEPLCLPAIDPAAARAQLAHWLAYYQTGQTQPLPFFARTSLHAAQKWQQSQQKNNTDTEPDDAVRAKAKTEYLGNAHGKDNKAQADYVEVAQVFGRDDVLPTENPLFWNLIRDLLLPLLTALTPRETESS